MSIVIGLVTRDGETYLASDYLVTEDNVVRVGTQEKAFLKPICDANGSEIFEMGFGVVGVPAVISALRYYFSPPPYVSVFREIDAYDEYVYGVLVPAIAALENARSSQWGLEAGGFGLMLVIKGYIWTVDSHYNAVRFEYPYDAIGSGERLALGALTALHLIRGAKLNKKDLAVAMQVAINLDSGCGGDPDIFEVT